MTDIPGNRRIPVSVLILTLNEADNIERCIGALDWCDDVVVLDSFSTDDTAGKARQLGARVFERKFDNFAGQRNYALEHLDLRHDWVLHLDADEVVTEELAAEISDVVQSGTFAAYKIPSRLMFRGKWLKYSGMYPVYQVRLGRKEQLKFVQVGHGQRESLEPSSVGTLQNACLHYGFSKGMTDWIERHNRYSSDEAIENLARVQTGGRPISGLFSSDGMERRRAAKVLATRVPFRPFLRFIYMYLLNRGIFDGSAGWTYCRLMAMYEYWTVLKEREISRRID